jgi:hypothetical protein
MWLWHVPYLRLQRLCATTLEGLMVCALIMIGRDEEPDEKNYTDQLMIRPSSETSLR